VRESPRVQIFSIKKSRRMRCHPLIGPGRGKACYLAADKPRAVLCHFCGAGSGLLIAISRIRVSSDRNIAVPVNVLRVAR